MSLKRKERFKEKMELHPRNRHRGRYDFQELQAACPELTPFVLRNAYGDESVDFADPAAVKMLNTALLKQYYALEYWDIPDGYLCPPIPGRADYIHYMAQLLGECNGGHIPTGPQIRCLDLGVGANCIYPIIGTREYGWSFVGSDIDPVAIDSAQRIITANPRLQGLVECRLQARSGDLFQGIIQPGEKFDLTVCNPPFYASIAEARASNLRKVHNLQMEKVAEPDRNFGGQKHELWCFGGEEKFVGDMIRQSRAFAGACAWFSTLVSKKDNLPGIYKTLDKVAATAVKTLKMGQGHKTSRVVTWTFLGQEERKAWRAARWSPGAFDPGTS